MHYLFWFALWMLRLVLKASKLVVFNQKTIHILFYGDHSYNNFNKQQYQNIQSQAFGQHSHTHQQHYQPQQQQQQNYNSGTNRNVIPITSYKNEISPDGSYSFGYSTGNGIQVFSFKLLRLNTGLFFIRPMKADTWRTVEALTKFKLHKAATGDINLLIFWISDSIFFSQLHSSQRTTYPSSLHCRWIRIQSRR